MKVLVWFIAQSVLCCVARYKHSPGAIQMSEAPSQPRDENGGDDVQALGANPDVALTPEARRALEEAKARREQGAAAPLPPEQGGPAGPEPTRYGDWEKGGVACDF
jgi:hypothetical protein